MIDFASISKLNMRTLPPGSGSVYFDVSHRVMNGSVAELDAPQPLHVRVALPAREQQAHRKALLGAKRLAVLRVDDERVVASFANGNAAREQTGIAAFGEEPLGVVLHADFAKQRRQRNAGPFAVRHHAVDLLRRHVRLRRAIRRASVARALDEVRARHRRKALEVGERELERTVDEAVNEQRVLRGIDRRRAGVDAREVEIRRRDRSGERLQRRERRARDFADRRTRRRDERRSCPDGGRRRARHFGWIAHAPVALTAAPEQHACRLLRITAATPVSSAPPAATAAPVISVRRVIGFSVMRVRVKLNSLRSTDAGAGDDGAAAGLFVRGRTSRRTIRLVAFGVVRHVGRCAAGGPIVLLAGRIGARHRRDVRGDVERLLIGERARPVERHVVLE